MLTMGPLAHMTVTIHELQSSRRPQSGRGTILAPPSTQSKGITHEQTHQSQVHAGRPAGRHAQAFRLQARRGAGADPRPGELLVKSLYLSVDPYMRGRMNDAKSYAAPVEIGGVMVRRRGGRSDRIEQPASSPSATSCKASSAGRSIRSATARGCARSIPRSRRSRPRWACWACRD